MKFKLITLAASSLLLPTVLHFWPGPLLPPPEEPPPSYDAATERKLVVYGLRLYARRFGLPFRTLGRMIWSLVRR